ncbi:Vegetative incompatibility protein [Paramyrothecium foliicola]|nr:Vegetative incompatibility protein [Paramyrothecium foliicola]
MRLLRTEVYELVEAKDIPDPFPEYAILSHTWISPKDEITYQDMKTRKGDIENDVFKQKGWDKVQRYCDRAAKDGWKWAWMDTCCIDKTSPADTQEAINAMFRWYQNAGICYVYLGDVDVRKTVAHGNYADPSGLEHLDVDEITGKNNVGNPNSFLHKALNPYFINAKWFSRGWTLQELLAPHYLVFVDREWRRIGTRENWASEIKEASRIEARYLTGFNPTDLKACSIAMRLSWASRRETTLEEDETYSLLGLFGISLPLIYGEGRWRAFNRLQRELIIHYNDDSMFAWKVDRNASSERFSQAQSGDSESQISGCGILAPSIREFWDSSNIRAFGLYGCKFSMTNRGLEINAKRWRRRDDPSLCHIRLNCGFKNGRSIVIYLNHVGDSYERISINELDDTGIIGANEWEEEPTRDPTLIRASNYSGPSAYSSIFVLELSSLIKTGKAYYVDFGISDFGASMQPLGDNMLSHRLADNELFLETNRLTFMNVELQHERIIFEYDIVINLTSAGFPSAGIFKRSEPGWERLGNPTGEALQTYEALAEHLHYSEQNKQIFPTIAVEETQGFVLGVHLLPRPRRPPDQLPREAKMMAFREYLLKVSVDIYSEDCQEQGNRKRRRNL